MREVVVEQRLVKGIKAQGGMCLKFISPGLRGVPDRIVVLPWNRIMFVETKAPTGQLSKFQEWVKRELQKRGVFVEVLYTVEAVDEFLKKVKHCEV